MGQENIFLARSLGHFLVQDKLSFNIHVCLSLKCEGLFASLDSFFFPHKRGKNANQLISMEACRQISTKSIPILHAAIRSNASDSGKPSRVS